MIGALAALALTATLTGAATAAPPGEGPHSVPSSEHINPRAHQAGVTRGGGGTMGWRSGVGPDDAAPTSARSTATSDATPDGGVDGLDVSHYQGSVDWAGYYGQGKRFAYVKATEGTYYTSDTFASQYNGSYDTGFIRGSYHFANPSDSSGASQAEYFVQHGGGWSGDGKTLPGALDIEYNPYSGGTCYGLSTAAMVAWIRDFTTTYESLTGRDAVIYTTTSWWNQCTGSSTAFGSTNPLWIARWASTPGTMPAGWSYRTFWQYTDTPVDQDSFNGSYSRLQALATG
ncbi:lysozyme [Nocardioides acrostichi]|nr:lysozyme [Nocardioides acrostichi]